MKKITTEDFIDRARQVHGDRYDYSKSIYSKTHEKLIITCLIHGDFMQAPNDHLRGQGCPLCGIERVASLKRLSLEQFVNKAMQIHGDRYDYSKVKYVNHSTKVCIICKEHGEFWQTPNAHLSGKGCPECGKKLVSINQFGLTTEQFIEKAKLVYGDKYDYTKSVYNGMFKKIVITCKKHGEFETIPINFLRGHGCRRCSVELNSKKRITTYNKILGCFNETHGDKYLYDETTYISRKKKMRIICPTHGEFWQSPDNHIKGQGCPSCKESFLEREVRVMLEKNNIKYIYEAKRNILPFLDRQSVDFFLPEYGIAIECQGEQHFKNKFNIRGIVSKTFNLNEILERDKRKNSLLISNNLKVLYYTNEKYYDISKNKFSWYNVNNTFYNIDDLIKRIKDGN